MRLNTTDQGGQSGLASRSEDLLLRTIVCARTGRESLTIRGTRVEIVATRMQGRLVQESLELAPLNCSAAAEQHGCNERLANEVIRDLEQ